MASVMIRTPIEKFFAANDKNDQKIILTSGVSYVKRFCDEQGLHFAYAVDERKKMALTLLGINLHPVPFLSHSHPFCKILENNQLVNVLPSLLGSGQWTFMSIKENKVEKIVKKNCKAETNISIINRCICAKDFSRYDFEPNEVDIRTNVLNEKHLFPENLLRSLKGKKIFIHDEVHHWNSKIMINFLEKVKPKILLCSVVYPPELLAGIKEPQNRTFYDFKVEGDKLFFFPDGNRSEFYEQPKDLRWLMKAKRFMLKDCNYTVKMVSSTYCHHLMQISRGEKITESKRFFSNFDTVDLKVIHNERFRYYDQIPIRKVHLEKVYTYLMCLKKPDVESAIAKLRQLMEDEQDSRVVAFFCKFARDVIEKFKGKIHLYETELISQMRDNFIQMLPNFWGRMLSRWHGLNLFDFLFKLDFLRVEFDLIDVDSDYSTRTHILDTAFWKPFNPSDGVLDEEYLSSIGLECEIDRAWSMGFKSKTTYTGSNSQLKLIDANIRFSKTLFSCTYFGAFNRVGILNYLHSRVVVGSKSEFPDDGVNKRDSVLSIKLRKNDAIDSYPEPFFLNLRNFSSKECPYDMLRWMPVHEKIWGPTFGVPEVPDEEYMKLMHQAVEVDYVDILSADFDEVNISSEISTCEPLCEPPKICAVEALASPNISDAYEPQIDVGVNGASALLEEDSELIKELEDSVTIIVHESEEFDYEEIEILGDGNCFYRSICTAVTGNSEGYLETKRKFHDHAIKIGFNLSKGMSESILKDGAFSDTWIINLFVNVMNIKLMIHESRDGSYYTIKPTLIVYDDTPLFEIHLLFENAHFTTLIKKVDVKEKEDNIRKEFREKYLLDDGFDQFPDLSKFISSCVGNTGKFKATKLNGRSAFFFSEHCGIDYGHDKIKYARNQVDDVNSLLPFHLRGSFNAMLVQIYEAGSGVPMHRDDEKVYDDGQILSINLEGTCKFLIEANSRQEVHEISLDKGTYLKMLPGFQKRFRHGVSDCSENRVNVTFRHHVRNMRGRDLINIDLTQIRNGCLLRAIAEAEEKGLNQVVQALLKSNEPFWNEWIAAQRGGTVDDLTQASVDLKFSFELLMDDDYKIMRSGGPTFKFQLKSGHFSCINERPSCVEMTYLNSEFSSTNPSGNFKKKKMDKLNFEHMNLSNFEAVGEFASLLRRSFLERTTGLILSECYGSSGEKLEKVEIDKNSSIFKEVSFICGFAGSGKSFSLQCRLRGEPKSDFLVICPRKELRNDWLEKVHCNEKKVRTFETALTLNLKEVDLIVIDELGLFPNGYLDLICYKLINERNLNCQVICLFDPLQSRYHSDLDDSILDFQHDCDRLLDGNDFLYLSESRRMSSSFFQNFFVDVHMHNDHQVPYSLTVFDSVIVAINQMNKEERPLDLILVASRDEKRALSCSVNTLTFGESQGLTVDRACIVLSEYSEKQDDLRWMVSLTRARIEVVFVCMYRGGFQCFIQNNVGRLIGLFLRQSPVTLNRMKLMVKGNLIPFKKSIGCSDEMDREDRLEGDPFLKPHIFLGQRINSEEIDVFEPEIVEPVCTTHIPIPPANFDQSINFDRIRAREFREFKYDQMSTRQFCEDFEHSRAMGKQMTSGPMRYEAIYPRHRADDDLTFWMAVKKRLRFSEEFIERAKLKEAMGVGGLLFANFKEKLNLKFNWNQQLLDECVNDFEQKKLQKSKATLQAHSTRSDSDWKLDHIFLFMKSQLCTKFEKQYVDAKAGQTLACFAHCILVKFAPYCRYMEKQLRSQFPDNIYIHSGKNFNDLNDWVKRFMNGQMSIESDYEAFDASQDEYILAFEVLLMEDMGMPNWFINDYIDLKCTLGCKLGHFAIMRFTGEFSTFLFNTLANMAFTFARYECDKNTPMAFAGDDMCMLANCEESEKFEMVFEKISLKAKVLRSETPMFCGWNLCKYGIFKEPALVYNRFKVAEERGNVSECLENYAIEVSYAYMLGEKLYEFLKEEERINYHQSVVRFIIKRVENLKTKVKYLYSDKYGQINQGEEPDQ